MYQPLVANYLTAKNDTNGNPRRGWHVKEIQFPGTEVIDSPTEWWVEEGYQGPRALLDWELKKFGSGHQGMYQHGVYNITVTEYNKLRKLPH